MKLQRLIWHAVQGGLAAGALLLAAVPMASAQTQLQPPTQPQTPAAAAQAAAASAPRPAPADAQLQAHGLFAQVEVYAPRGDPQQLVLLLSRAAGPDDEDRRQARVLAAQGAMVALLDTPAFAARLDREGGTCGYPAGAFENLSRHLQAFYKFKGYRAPLLVGRGAGGALAYGLLAQADSGTFGGAVSVNFCARLPFRQPLCAVKALPPSTPASVPSVFAAAASAAAASPAAPAGSRLTPATAPLPAPWWVLQTADAPVCSLDAAASAPAGPQTAQAFAARVRDVQWRTVAAGTPALAGAIDHAYTQLAARNRPPPPVPASLSDLPIVEVPPLSVPVPATAAGPAALPGQPSPPSQRFAVLVSGDGGWAGIDKALAAALLARGVPVAGFDSLRYFWSARTPAGLATDLDRVARYYANRWKRSELILIGFSQGADVLPFAINRLEPDVRARLKLTTLISPAQKASFEFKVSNWLGPSGDVPVLPEAVKLDAAATLCVHGKDDKESVCPALQSTGVRTITLNGGHHLDGDYDKLARLILESLGP